MKTDWQQYVVQEVYFVRAITDPNTKNEELFFRGPFVREAQAKSFATRLRNTHDDWEIAVLPYQLVPL